MLDSIAVVGLGERNILPGYVREWGHHVGLQGVRSVMMGLVDDSLASFQKIIVYGVAGGGVVHQQKRSLLSGHIPELGHHGGLQGVEIVRWTLLMIRAPLQPSELIFFVKGSSAGP